jgi:hypothetical protein
MEAHHDDWLDSFTFMEDVAEVNFLLDFPFEISIDENAVLSSPQVCEESDVSEITDVSGCSTKDATFSSGAVAEAKVPEQKIETVTIKKRKGPVSKYKFAKAQQRIPNMSRARPAVLYAFPSFDKCDSLLFFPTSMSRLSNSGDLTGLTKLVKTHFHRNCVTVLKSTNLDLPGTLKMFEIYDMLCPDSMECVSQTKVIENTIEATLVAKYTESNALYHSVRQKLLGTPFEGFLGGSRSEFLRNATFVDEAAQEEFRASSLPESGLDFTVHASLYIKLTFDDLHRKVTRMDFGMATNTMQPIS